MNKDRINTMLHIFRHTYPSYPEPTDIRVVQGESSTGKMYEVVALSDEYGLLAAYHARPSGSIDEVVPFPMKWPDPKCVQRECLSLDGLPDWPAREIAMSQIWDPNRLTMIAKWNADFAHFCEELATQHRRDLNARLADATRNGTPLIYVSGSAAVLRGATDSNVEDFAEMEISLKEFYGLRGCFDYCADQLTIRAIGIARVDNPEGFDPFPDEDANLLAFETGEAFKVWRSSTTHQR